MIPIKNENGIIIGFGGRVLPDPIINNSNNNNSNSIPKKVAKYINSPGSIGHLLLLLLLLLLSFLLLLLLLPIHIKFLI